MRGAALSIFVVSGALATFAFWLLRSGPADAASPAHWVRAPLLAVTIVLGLAALVMVASGIPDARRGR